MKARFDTPIDPYYEVEWLDENGDAHHVTFAEPGPASKDFSEAMGAFIKAIEPTCAMIAVYRVWKERL